MKHIYIVIMLTIPVYLHAQSVAPRRPLALEQPTTRKTLLKLREGITEKQNKGIYDNTHELKHLTQQKPGQATETD